MKTTQSFVDVARRGRLVLSQGVLAMTLAGLGWMARTAASDRPAAVAPLAPQCQEALASTPQQLLAEQPLTFVENRGQWDHPARYVLRLPAMTTLVEEAGWLLAKEEETGAGELRGAALRMRFEGGAAAPVLEPEEPLPGYHNYFLGNDPGRWRSRVPLFAELRYRGVYPGVEVRLREAAGRFEYGLTVWALRERIWAGHIPCIRFPGGRKMYIDTADLDSFIQRNKSTID